MEAARESYLVSQAQEKGLHFCDSVPIQGHRRAITVGLNRGMCEERS